MLLVDVENHQILHTLELKGEIVSINWTQNTKESYDDFDDLQGNTKLVCIEAFTFLSLEIVQEITVAFIPLNSIEVCQWTQGISCIIPQLQFPHIEYTQA